MFGILPLEAPFKDSPNDLFQFRSPPPNQHPRLMQDNSDSIALEDKPFHASPMIPMNLQQRSLRPFGFTPTGSNPIPLEATPPSALPTAIRFQVKPASTSPNAAVPPCSMSPQQQFEVPLVSLVQPMPDSEIQTPALFTVPSIPQQQRSVKVTSQVPNIQEPDQQEVLLDHKTSSPNSRLILALTLVVLTVPLLPLLIVSSTLFACPRKLRMYEDLSNNRNGTIKSGNNLTRQPQLVQSTPHAVPRF